MAFDLKKDWPIVAAGGAVVVGYLMLRGSSSAGSTADYTPAATTNDSTDQGPNANQLALIEAAMSIDAQNQQYEDELNLAQLSSNTSEYNSYQSNLDSEFNSILGFNTAAVQSNAAVQAVKAQQPSGVTQWLSGLTGLASAVAPFFTHVPSSTPAPTTSAPAGYAIA